VPDTVITAATGDTLKWNIADITTVPYYYGYYDFSFMYTTDISATIGDTVHITLIVSPITGDADTTNNVYKRDFVVGNSYDPNGKDVSPVGSTASGFIPASTPKLDYTVNFQNTGTAAAQNLYILDTLDADVDITSLHILTSSHPVTTTFLPGNVLKFNFSNIMLPDASSNEMGSHGFVKYSIAPNSGLNPGDQITNKAYIYFDFNPPIITNTAVNTIEFPSGIMENSNYNLSVFPNPTTNSLNIVFEDKQNKIVSLKILNMAGQVVYEENTTPSRKYSKLIDLKDYPQGFYLLEINTDKQVIHKKVIKN
jgi:hypothetical protein